MKTLYLQDSRPWIIGLSGGKDSTCITQLVYSMLLELPPDKRHKRVYVLSADVMVESPHADYRRRHICKLIDKQVKIDKIPLSIETLRPLLTDTFWVNLIGRGYPSPNRWFRWCTDRMKIRPMNRFVYSQIKENGEVIMVLGIRKSESTNRKRAIERYEISGSKLSQHSEIKGALVYAPISEWNDIEDVREYLRSTPSPWGDNNNGFL
ncbi:MAG: phosphoadenosine phosphosulfate reductase family protein, partial [Candidatus Cloacimonadaceae bacterium]